MSLIRKLIIEAIKMSDKHSRYFYGDIISDLIDDPSLINNYSWTDEKGLYPIGAGQSRGVYGIKGDDTLVIKKSISDRGVLDNKKESKYFKTYSNVFPKTYAHAPDYDWIIVEKVDVIGNDSSDVVEMIKKFMPVLYKKITLNMINLGLDRKNHNNIKDAYYDFIFNLHARKEGLKTLAKDQSQGNKENFNRIFKRFIELIKGRDVNILYSEKDIYEVVSSDPTFYKLFKAASQLGIAFRELRGDNLGIDKDGNIVLIDLSVFENSMSYEI